MSRSFRGGPHDGQRLLLKTLSFLFICFEHVTRVPRTNLTRYRRVSAKNKSPATTATVTQFSFEETHAATTVRLSSQSWPQSRHIWVHMVQFAQTGVSQVSQCLHLPVCPGAAPPALKQTSLPWSLFPSSLRKLSSALWDRAS